MAYLDLAIDIGTSKTAIYEKGIGLVLSEPSVVAISQGKTMGLKCAGLEAKKLIGKAPPNTKISFPVFEGLITLPFATSLMLKHFLSKIINKNTFLKPKIRALITVPCGTTVQDKQVFESVANDAGINEAIIVESPNITGLALPCSLKSPVLIVDIGGGKTDIAVVSEEGIISGCSLGIGGNNVDTGLIDVFSDEHKFKIGLLTAEKIKIQIGSLFENDTKLITVNGKDVDKGVPCSMEIISKGIYPTISYYYLKIAEVINSLVKDLDKKTAETINRSGAYLIGGASAITGLSKFYGDYLKMPINFIEDYSYAAVNGAARALSDKSLLKRILEM